MTNRNDCPQSSEAANKVRSRHQFVAARFSDQDGRSGGILLDLLPQSIDVRLERVRGDSRVVAPDLLQQRLPRYRPLAGAVEVAQDRGLLLGQADLAALGIEQQLRAFRQVIDEVNTTTINQITQNNLRSTIAPIGRSQGVSFQILSKTIHRTS